MQIKITRPINLPDPVKLELYRRCPDLGPEILFFSGGSALKDSCLELTQYTHNSIHIITPFDSGGSSAKLRDAFKMPAIGDVRNRLLALADRSLKGHPEIFNFFAYRFPKNGKPDQLASELDNMIQGRHPIVAKIPDPMQNIIRYNLDLFKDYMPDTFDLRKASLGNLVLTAGYLDNQRNFDTIIYIFSKLVQALGIVRPVVNKYMHLITELEDNQLIIGQHMLTGKETSPISSKVKKVWLSKTRNSPEKTDISIQNKMIDLIGNAELICYPIGSFYSSLIANLLPSGVGKAVAANPCPKIFIPNTSNLDPETYGLSLSDQIELLLYYLTKDDPENISTKDVLNFILIDKEKGNYSGNTNMLNNMEFDVIDTNLVSKKSNPYIDEKLLIPLLLSLT